MWEGAPARLAGRCTELKRTASVCQYTQPIWLLETLNILMQGFLIFWLSVAPTVAISWVALGFMFPGRAVLKRIFRRDAAVRDRLAPGPLRVRHHTGSASS